MFTGPFSRMSRSYYLEKFKTAYQKWELLYNNVEPFLGMCFWLSFKILPSSREPFFREKYVKART